MEKYLVQLTCARGVVQIEELLCYSNSLLRLWVYCTNALANF